MEKLNELVKLLDYLKSIVENDAELKKDGDLSEVLQTIDMTIKEFVNVNKDIDDATLNATAEMLGVFFLGSTYLNYEKSVNIVKNIYNKFSDDKNILEMLNKIVKYYNQNGEDKIDMADITKKEIKTQESESKKEIIKERLSDVETKTEVPVSGKMQEGKVEIVREGRRGRRPKVEVPVAGKMQESKKEIIKERLRDVRPKIREKVAGKMQEGGKMIKRRELHTYSNKLLKKYNISIDYDKYLDKFVFSLLSDKSISDQIIKKEITDIFKTHMSAIANFVFTSYDASDIRHRLNTALYAVIKQNLFIINLIVAASKVLKEESGGIVRVEINISKHHIAKMYKKLLDKMLDEFIDKHSDSKKKSRKHKEE